MRTKRYQPPQGARRRELGREAAKWFLEDLGDHVPDRYLQLAHEAAADVLEAVAAARRRPQTPASR
jgi:hypothetical protein